ncbi:MAG: DUF3052 domain-containing protein [Saprospiraceae bacterium]
MTSGYSRTPLIKKLGIKDNFRVRLIHSPANYFDLLGELPNNVIFLQRKSKEVDFIHLFAKDIKTFEKSFYKIKDEIKKDGMIWVSWYKKASKIPTDMSEDVIRNTALANGLVDVKVCAVDEKWSGLKIVWRKENR